MSFSISSEAIPAVERRRGRRTALALFAVVALPVAAAFLAFFFWYPAHGTNYGELIRPLPLPDAPLVARDGRLFRLSDFRGKWVMVQVGSGRCAEDCVKRLFLMRQTRLMQGRQMDRLERLWLVADEVAPDPALLRAYEGMNVGRAQASVLQLFSAEDDPSEHVYLVDPLGNLMLRFPRDADPKRVSRDRSRLLEGSQVC